jgi:hypothetical protein
MPIAFIGALALLASRTCSSETASSEIRFVVGDAPVTSVRADLYSDDSDRGLGYFESTRIDAQGVAGVWKLTTDAGLYRLAIEVRLPDRVENLSRRVELRDRAQVVVDLSRDLR